MNLNIDLKDLPFEEVKHVLAEVEDGEPVITIGRHGGSFVVASHEIDKDTTAFVVMFRNDFERVTGEIMECKK